jgi:CelD/BcsL family acetyltransferase involved in cellulose biosynthesis
MKHLMTEPLVFTIVETSKQFDLLEAEWNELFDKSHNSSLSLEYNWLREWWRIFGKGKKKLFIITARAGGVLVGVLPLYTKTSRLGLRKMSFIGIEETAHGGVYPEYCDMLCELSWASTLKSKVSAFLNSKDLYLKWNELNLGIISQDSVLSSLKHYCSENGLIDRGCEHTSYIATLADGFEGYLRQLSSNRRQRFRRLIKSFELEGGEFKVAKDRPEARKFLSELIELHQKRWSQAGQIGAFHSVELKEFHGRLLGESLLRNGRVFLSRTSVHGEVQALLYGFIIRNRFEFYQSGINLESKHSKSPGFLAHLLTMRYLANSMSLSEYDFLAGDSEYKKQLSTTSRTLIQQRVSRPGVITRLRRLTDLLKARLNRIIQTRTI